MQRGAGLATENRGRDKSIAGFSFLFFFYRQLSAASSAAKLTIKDALTSLILLLTEAKMSA